MEITEASVGTSEWKEVTCRRIERAHNFVERVDWIHVNFGENFHYNPCDLGN
jgi:hypothetical protein